MRVWEEDRDQKGKDWEGYGSHLMHLFTGSLNVWELLRRKSVVTESSYGFR